MFNFLANPKVEDVFKSVGDSLDAKVNPNHIVLIVVAIVGVIVLVSLLTRRTETKAKPKPLNNSAKLLRDVAKQVGLKPKELRQLKQLAEQEGIENPLTLLLCPSVLQAAMKKRQQAARR
jgi:hypothetical protein